MLLGQHINSIRFDIFSSYSFFVFYQSKNNILSIEKENQNTMKIKDHPRVFSLGIIWLRSTYFSRKKNICYVRTVHLLRPRCLFDVIKEIRIREKRNDLCDLSILEILHDS
jgi:hypothetical protein